MLCLAFTCFRIRFSAMMRAPPTPGIHCEPRYSREQLAQIPKVSTVKGYIEPSPYQFAVIVEQIKYSGPLQVQPSPSDCSACKRIIALRPRHPRSASSLGHQLCFQISDNHLNPSEYTNILFGYPTQGADSLFSIPRLLATAA